jgi:hypothetical protein
MLQHARQELIGLRKLLLSLRQQLLGFVLFQFHTVEFPVESDLPLPAEKADHCGSNNQDVLFPLSINYHPPNPLVKNKK